jgi:hypothetical protein
MGAQAYLQEAEKIGLGAVEEDQAEEVECMENSLDLDHDLSRATATGQEASTDDSGLSNLSMLSDNLKKASAGVILDTTIANYDREAH